MRIIVIVMMRIILLRNNIKNDSDNYDCNDRRNQNVSVLCIEIHQLMESSPQKKTKKTTTKTSILWMATV